MLWRLNNLRRLVFNFGWCKLQGCKVGVDNLGVIWAQHAKNAHRRNFVIRDSMRLPWR